MGSCLAAIHLHMGAILPTALSYHTTPPHSLRAFSHTTLHLLPTIPGGVTLVVQLFGGLTNVSFLNSSLEILPGNVKWSIAVDKW